MQYNYQKVLLDAQTPFAIAEAFKEIRTNMLYTAREVRCPVYAVTSAFAHAGKSVLVANLALSFAELGKRVLLMDCDLRNPVQHKIFGVPRSFGISELAAGMSEEVEKAILPTENERLQLIPSGHIPPNPAELLSSSHFEKLIRGMQERYDFIFLDFPPTGVVVDALVPARLVTGYALVVRSGADDKRALGQAITSMKNVDANLIGFILNDVNPKSNAYYGSLDRHRYRGGYRYHYNYSYSKPLVQTEEEKSNETTPALRRDEPKP